MPFRKVIPVNFGGGSTKAAQTDLTPPQGPAPQNHAQNQDYVRAALLKRLEAIGPEQDQIAADFYALEHKKADIARLQAIVDKRAEALEMKLRAAQDDMRRQLEALLRQQNDMERELARAEADMLALRNRRRQLQDEKIAIARALESPEKALQESLHESLREVSEESQAYVAPRQRPLFPAFRVSFAAAAALWDGNKNYSISIA